MTDSAHTGDRNRGEVLQTLRQDHFVGPRATITELSGGISCFVGLLSDDQREFVVKAGSSRLRTERLWVASPARTSREARVLRAVLGKLGPLAVPEVLYENQDQHMFVMTSLAASRGTWKEQLLTGSASPVTATALGSGIASLQRSDLHNEFSDSFGISLFRQLRIDPFYRAVASCHADLRADIDELIDTLIHPEDAVLVHGDCSPKNVLPLDDGTTALLDWEVASSGDRSFDPAMLLAHLACKSLVGDEAQRLAVAQSAANFYAAYVDDGGCADVTLVGRHVGAIVLARLDGVSPVDYLTQQADRQNARELGRDAIRGKISIGDLFEWMRH